MKYSRIQLARVYARLLMKHSSSELARGFAHFFAQHRMKRETDMFGEDVLAAWQREHNTVIATVTSARELSAASRTKIELYIARQEEVSHVHAAYHIDASLIGGARIETPHHTYTFSVHDKLKGIL